MSKRTSWLIIAAAGLCWLTVAVLSGRSARLTALSYVEDEGVAAFCTGYIADKQTCIVQIMAMPMAQRAEIVNGLEWRR